MSDAGLGSANCPPRLTLGSLLKGSSPGISAISHPADVLMPGAEPQERQKNSTAL